MAMPGSLVNARSMLLVQIVGAIADRDLSGVRRVADTHATAIVD
jgi:hypothetical protein